MANHRMMGSGALASAAAAAVDFDVLYREHAAQVRALAYRRLGDRAQADDVVQETFLRAYRALDRLDPERPAWPWLRTIADHICTDLLRRAGVVVETPVGHHDRDQAVPGEGDPSADAYLSAQRRAGIKDAFEGIHPRQRRMLVLQAVEGWSPGAVAEAEGMTVTAVRATLKRGRQSFRRNYLALAARRGLLGIVGVLAGLGARARLEAVRAQRCVARLGGPCIESAVPAGFVSVALAVGAVTGAGGVGERPPPVAELESGTGGAEASAVDLAQAIAELSEGRPGAPARDPDAGATGGDTTTSWGKSVGAAPGPVALDASAGLEEEATDDRVTIGTKQRLPGHERDTEAWHTIPCEGSVIGGAVCKVVRTVPDE